MFNGYYILKTTNEEELIMNKDFITQVKGTLVAHKKKVWSVVILVALLGVFSVGAHAMFQVRGVVTSVDSNRISVANFFGTQTVDLTGSPINVSDIKPGDRVKIQKNLQGQVIYAWNYSHK